MRAAPSERLTDLLDAACAAICERGAEAVRMQAIADRAGVSRTLLHYHFSSRRDLLHQAFEHADLEVDRYVEARLETCGTPRERLDCVLGSYLDDEPAVRTNWGVWLELRRAAIHDPSLRPAVDASYDSWVESVAGLLAQCGLTAGAVPAAIRLCALVDGLGEQMLLGRLIPEDARRLLGHAVASEL
ncbi:MAG: TetR/AcrR family transcriptional regulator [Gaiellales bacterium]